MTCGLDNEYNYSTMNIMNIIIVPGLRVPDFLGTILPTKQSFRYVCVLTSARDFH